MPKMDGDALMQTSGYPRGDLRPPELALGPSRFGGEVNLRNFISSGVATTARTKVPHCRQVHDPGRGLHAWPVTETNADAPPTSPGWTYSERSAKGISTGESLLANRFCPCSPSDAATAAMPSGSSPTAVCGGQGSRRFESAMST